MIIDPRPPGVIVVITTVWLGCYVQKVAGLQQEAVLTLLMVSGVFCVAYTPMGLYFVINLVVGCEVKSSLAFIGYCRFATFLGYFNYLANPVIYYVSIRSYRTFVNDVTMAFRGKLNSVALAFIGRVWGGVCVLRRSVMRLQTKYLSVQTSKVGPE